MGKSNKRLLFWIGLGLLSASLLGFLFVADDLRHTGELLGCSGLAFAGLVLLFVSRFRQRRL